MSTTNPVLPSQGIDLTVPNPHASAQLGLPVYQGAGYQADFKSWALLQDGGFMKFKLTVSQPVPVQLVATLCATLVDGHPNCPFSITVNDYPFVADQAQTNPNFHPVSWTIPQGLMSAGDNTIVFRLGATATTRLLINHLAVADALLPTQGIDFSVPNPSATPQFGLPFYQGAGYRADLKSWTLLQDGGFMKFNLDVSEPIPVGLTLDLAAALIEGKANCPIAITVNGQTLVASYADVNPNFHPVSWTIPQAMLTAGNNTIIVTLLQSSTTQLLLNRVTVTG